ncbi:MAG: hypothetical protein LQ343_006501 [Gyalolechia ehrenbergii]|nr:MAG: hypothetical protein LQ343_006501 [Gyalolechia ehrenbergii]
MQASSVLLVFLAPFLALALPQVGGVFPSSSVLSAISTSNGSAPVITLEATAIVTASGALTPSLTSAQAPGLASSAGIPTSSGSAAPPADTSLANDLSTIGQLISAAKAPDRINLIPNDASFKFDFENPPDKTETKGSGGRTIRADRESFPPLIGTGVSMTVGFLGPCGFNTPHTHPRSSEINIVVQGTLQTQFTLENGARTVHNTLGTYQMTVFPHGALHTEFNPDCNEAIFVAGFASEDPGVQQAAQSFFGFDSDFVQAALGNDFTFQGKDLGKFKSLIPANVALGVESCLKKCQIG